MTSPFEFSRHSGYTHSPYSLPTAKVSRPPIHNPYDKFTQPEFDAWIGGITGALRRALGQEDEAEGQPTPKFLEEDAFYSSGEEEVHQLIDEDESVDEELDDSFAGFKARRVGKGKARDPRDGPGFGKGDKNEPIIIGSDSEEEEEGEEEEAHALEGEEDEDGSEEWDDTEQSGEEEEEKSWGKGESSTQARIRHEKERLDVQEYEEYEEEGEGEQSDQEEDYEYEVKESKKAPSPVLILSSDEEQDEAPPVYELDEEDSSGDHSEEDDEADTAMLVAPSHSPIIRPPRHRAREEYEQQPSSPVAEDIDHVEEDNKIEEDDEDVQPLDDDTSFPPHTVAPSLSVTENLVEIRDPWSGPKTYAEDYYSGGDIREKPEELTTDHLGPGEEGETPTKRGEPLEDRDIIDVDEVDDKDLEEVQPLFEDTSFPPHDTTDNPIPSDYPIELPDHWAGPKIYAEDYYSGGDVRPSQDAPLDAHHLGVNDEVVSPVISVATLIAESEHRAGAEVLQSPEAFEQLAVENTFFLPQVVPLGVSQTDYPDELPHRWDGSAEHAEDYYTEDDLRPGPAVGLSVDHLGAGDDDDTPIIIDSSEDNDEPNKAASKADAAAELKVESAHEEDHQIDPHDVTRTAEFDFGGFYDDMAVETFRDSPDSQHVDLSHIDWDYASALLNQLPASAVNQLEVAVGEVADPDVADGHQGPEDPSGCMNGVPGIHFEPLVETVTEPSEESVAVIEPAIPPAEEALGLEAPDAPSGPPQTPPTLSAPFHRHEFGLPTPPSERGKDNDLPAASEQEDSFNTGKDIIMVMDSDHLLVETTNAINVDVSASPEIEALSGIEEPKELKEDDGAEADANGEVDLDAVAVSYPLAEVQAEEGLTQDAVINLSSHEALDAHATAFVEFPMKEPAVESDSIQVDTNSKLTKAAGADLDPFVPAISDETAQVEATITSIGDIATGTSKSDPRLFSPRNGVSMPVCADPAVPDPTSRPHTSSAQQSILSLPGSPFTVSPAGTPGRGRHTSVSVPLPHSILKALGMQRSRPGDSPNGLFTPVPDADSGPTSPEPGTVQNENVMELKVAEQSASTTLGDVVAAPVAESPPSYPSTNPLAYILEPQNTAQSGSNDEDQTTAALLLQDKESVPPLTVQSEQAEPVPPSSMPKLSSPHNAPSEPYPMRVTMRKTTDTILLSDPYPASLSTPSYLVKENQYESFDEENSQDNTLSSNSISSSTVDKELEFRVDDSVLDGFILDEDIHTVASMELRYPSLQPTGQEQVSPAVVLRKGDLGTHDLNEVDADGDLDPDFVEKAGKAHGPSPPPAPRPTDDKALEPDGHMTPIPKILEQEEKEMDNQNPAQQKSSPPVDRASASAMSAASPKSDDDLPSILIIKKPAVVRNRRNDPHDDSDEPPDLDEASRGAAKSKPTRPSKRKRSSSTTATSPLTRSISSKQLEKKQVSSRPAPKPRISNVTKTSSKTSPGKDKGKGKEVRTPSDKGSFDTRSISSRSSSDASSALRMLYPSNSSQNTSRASSVVSNAPSDSSSITVQPSPTLNKGSSFRHHVPPPPPPPLLHKHRPPPGQPARPATAQKTTFPSRQADLLSTETVANKPSTSTQTASPHHTPIHSSSPVTRSNCRYHKISIPREEDGPRIHFLVPGCSLGNRELIEEEEITDHGDALPEDGKGATGDLDAYAFDPYLIGVLRLLAGVDMLREQEVYYLPQLGPNLVPLRRRSRVSTSSRTSSHDVPGSVDHAGPVGASPRRNSTASAISPPSSKAPVSAAGSTSTSASAVRSVKHSDMMSSSVVSYSESELTEDENSPRAKRARPSPVEGKSTIGDMGPPDASTRSRKSISRLSMRLGQDPDIDGVGDSQDEGTQQERSHSSNTSKLGIKRSRTSDVFRESDADTQKLKKQKTGSSA